MRVIGVGLYIVFWQEDDWRRAVYCAFITKKKTKNRCHKRINVYFSTSLQNRYNKLFINFLFSYYVYYMEKITDHYRNNL